MNLIRQNKKEIIISFVTGILLFYAQPVLSYLGDLFVNSVVLVSDTFSVMYYIAVAKNNPNTLGETTNVILIYVLLILLVNFVLSVRERKRKLKSRIEKNLLSISADRERLKRTSETKTKEEIEAVRDAVIKDMDRIEEESKTLRRRLEERDTNLLMFSILGAFLVALMFSNYAINTSVANENTMFRNELIKLEPFINDIEVKKLRASWAEMKTKADYEVVIERLSTLKKSVDKK